MIKKTIKGSLMVQGTTSDAGKTICVAGLCRVLSRQGISVAPFKPQNMALNSAVTKKGEEIGRAQALQARACGLELRTDFNPVLLKPNSDMSSQVIIHGHAVSQLEAKSFGSIKQLAFSQVLESYQRLTKEFDVVLIEGAGSPAEINLRKNDIANMGFAEAVDCPVLLISDIDRGGVFAHLTGTLNLLSQSEQDRIKGFIINQFRGNISLLQNGLDWLEGDTNKSVLGVIPYIKELKLDAEDAIKNNRHSHPKSTISIKVPVLPRISNHTDFEPLIWHPQVKLEYIGPKQSLQGADLIILPGTKSVRDDLTFFKQQGWDQQIKRHCRYGGKLLGICGGFQMLGKAVHDPLGVESQAGSTAALNLLDFETKLSGVKQLKQVKGSFDFYHFKGAIHGYEIHCGTSYGRALKLPFSKLEDQHHNCYSEGVVSDDGLILGTYIHGLFESKQSIQAMLSWVSGKEHKVIDWAQTREQELERLADIFEQHLDIDKILKLIA